jgi:uncharacterized protein
MQRNIKSFLGNGLHFPVRMNARGEIMLVTGSEDIEQSIRIILSTRPGERVMRPTFGCRAHDLLFEPRSAATASLLTDYVYEALQMWEPRIEVQDVSVTAGGADDSALLVEIVYQIKSTHDTRSIVYPFFIEAEQEIQ